MANQRASTFGRGDRDRMPHGFSPIQAFAVGAFLLPLKQMRQVG